MGVEACQNQAGRRSSRATARIAALAYSKREAVGYSEPTSYRDEMMRPRPPARCGWR